MQMCRQQFSETYFRARDQRKEGRREKTKRELIPGKNQMRHLMNIGPLFPGTRVATYFRGSEEEISQAPLSAGCGAPALGGVINSILTYLEKLLGRAGENVAPKEALELHSKICHFQQSFNSSFEAVDPS